jgi:hypothetical protein
MAENRIDRELTTRDKTSRKKGWQRPEVLPSPNPEDGYVYRWIRTSTQGQVDAPNVSSKLREGWEPVKANEHPEITMVAVENERFADNIVIGGLMLCKAPKNWLMSVRHIIMHKRKIKSVLLIITSCVRTTLECRYLMNGSRRLLLEKAINIGV